MVQAESNMTPNTMGPGRMAKAELKAKATLILTALSLGSTARRVMRKFGSLAEAPTSEPKAMMAMKALKAPPQPEGQYPDTALENSFADEDEVGLPLIAVTVPRHSP